MGQGQRKAVSQGTPPMCGFEVRRVFPECGIHILTAHEADGMKVVDHFVSLLSAFIPHEAVLVDFTKVHGVNDTLTSQQRRFDNIRALFITQEGNNRASPGLSP